METSSILLVCILVSCSVHGRSFEINIDDQDQKEVEISVEARQFVGICWACEWAVKNVKKDIGPNATSENLKSKLLKVCDGIHMLKSRCKRFVKDHLSELIEELKTTNDVRTICVNTKACSPKELSHLILYLRGEESPTEINDCP
ncbi:antimicrobial peptide NK-lysin-like [Trachinotus anak]|uniref:antimicrobial peptide NK-lysin-like n=1 Tax=Trachinotus anak TaxID=443729 RepID=UPI0039F185B3